MKKLGMRAATAFALLMGVFCSATASAQGAAAKPATQPPATRTTADYTEQATGGGDQVVTFGGDQLAGDPESAYGFTIRRPPGVLRAGLLRPRVNFVSELLKSVENL